MSDLFNSLMYQNTTLFISIFIVAALTYIGANVINPSYTQLRRFVGYLTSAALIAIGGAGLYFGASREIAFIYAHVYVVDPMRVAWIMLGMLSIIAGLLLAHQSQSRM